MRPLQIYVVQRRSDRQWTFRVFASNGKKVGWAGEFYRRKASVTAAWFVWTAGDGAARFGRFQNDVVTPAERDELIAAERLVA